MVSVLFCEPKIRKTVFADDFDIADVRFQCSSASRKFGKPQTRNGFDPPALFQCSSASRKFGKVEIGLVVIIVLPLFQCSSASRKFGKTSSRANADSPQEFQCSSASRKFGKVGEGERHLFTQPVVSVLFCEPKIRKTGLWKAVERGEACFSALLRAENSEKWPPSASGDSRTPFQCSSASRKFGK